MECLLVEGADGARECTAFVIHHREDHSGLQTRKQARGSIVTALLPSSTRSGLFGKRQEAQRHRELEAGQGQANMERSK